jgi:hypothetical protein
MFSNTPVYTVNGIIQFGLLTDAVVADPSDQLYTIPAAGVERLDLISNEFYGTTELWWVIALVNNFQDALVGFPINSQIRIPTRQRLASEGILSV